jgi:hypothetical protein
MRPAFERAALTQTHPGPEQWAFVAIIIGFIAGVIAKFIMPGDNEPSGSF